MYTNFKTLQKLKGGDKWKLIEMVVKWKIKIKGI